MILGRRGSTEGGKNEKGQREPPAQLLPRMVDEIISYPIRYVGCQVELSRSSHGRLYLWGAVTWLAIRKISSSSSRRLGCSVRLAEPALRSALQRLTSTWGMRRHDSGGVAWRR